MSDESMADPDFRSAYFGGDFDVPCSFCKGLRVTDVVDEDRLTKKMLERYWRALDEKRYFERAWGER